MFRTDGEEKMWVGWRYWLEKDIIMLEGRHVLEKSNVLFTRLELDNKKGAIKLLRVCSRFPNNKWQHKEQIGREITEMCKNYSCDFGSYQMKPLIG